MKRALVDCVRHPFGAAQGRYCAACLLEEALATERHAVWNRTTTAIGGQDSEAGQLTILVPLGVRASASIFLVRIHGEASRLLRLKAWRSPAPPDFLARFQELRTRLNDWSGRPIDPPIAASIDATGCPSVLSEFRQGIPVLDGVRSGALHYHDALARLEALSELTHGAHQRGLIHGSIVAGNVIMQPGSPAAWLLDFGVGSLLNKGRDDAPLAAADVAGFRRLARTLREMAPHPVLQRL